MLTGKQKLYFLLNRIDGKRILTASGKPILIHPMGDLNGEYPNIELLLLLKKLQDDEKVLKVTRTPLSEEEKGYNPRYEDDYYGLELLPAWGDYFAKIQQESEYQEFTGKKPVAQNPQEPPKKEEIQNSVYEVKYSEQTREILINNFLVKKLRSFSDNDAIFAYIYKNPNKELSDDDIKGATKLNHIKDLNKFLDDIGFTGQLRRVFFKVSKSIIRFNNPITREYLEEIGIERLKLVN